MVVTLCSHSCEISWQNQLLAPINCSGLTLIAFLSAEEEMFAASCLPSDTWEQTSPGPSHGSHAPSSLVSQLCSCRDLC